MRVLAPASEPEHLALLAQGGDEAALNALMERFYGPIFSFVRRMLPHEEDARDVTQDVFARLVRNLGSYRPDRRFSTWLFRIAVNRVVDCRRRRPPPEPLRSATFTPGDIVSCVESRDRLFAAVAGLPDSVRLPLLLSYQQDLSHAEIGDILKISANAVKLRVHDAIQRLRILLKEAP